MRVQIKGYRIQMNSLPDRVCEHGCAGFIEPGEFYVRVMREDETIELFDAYCFREEFGVSELSFGKKKEEKVKRRKRLARRERVREVRRLREEDKISEEELRFYTKKIQEYQYDQYRKALLAGSASTWRPDHASQ